MLCQGRRVFNNGMLAYAHTIFKKTRTYEIFNVNTAVEMEAGVCFFSVKSYLKKKKTRMELGSGNLRIRSINYIFIRACGKIKTLINNKLRRRVLVIFDQTKDGTGFLSKCPHSSLIFSWIHGSEINLCKKKSRR